MKTITDKFTKFMKSQGIKVVDCTPKTMQKKPKLSKEDIWGEFCKRFGLCRNPKHSDKCECYRDLKWVKQNFIPKNK
jgi:hypothetical protein